MFRGYDGRYPVGEWLSKPDDVVRYKRLKIALFERT